MRPRSGQDGTHFSNAGERRARYAQRRILDFNWIASLLVFLAMTVLIGACAKRPQPKPTPIPKKPPAAMPVPTPPPPETLTPKREASMKMVNIGQEYLEKREFDKAVQTFQEAINVDSENGVAYFFMAKALYENQAYDDAVGLLDRAESMLAAYPEWVDQVYNLRILIQEGKTAQTKQKEKQKEKQKDVYY